jgi:hypothetical protein
MAWLGGGYASDMTSSPRTDDLPEEMPGGLTIADPEVFNDPEGAAADEPDADYLPPDT